MPNGGIQVLIAAECQPCQRAIRVDLAAPAALNGLRSLPEQAAPAKGA